MSSLRIRLLWASCLVTLVALLGSAAPAQLQIIESRLSNVERRLDQVQSRIDSVEREQRMSSLSSSTRPEVSREMVLELQRQQNDVAQQVVLLEQRMLEVRKAIDRLSAAQVEKKDEVKPKAVEGQKRKP